MKKELPQEAIEAGAEWWTRILTVPAKHDNGDPGGFGGAMADIGSRKLQPPTPEQLQIFKTTLMDLIKEESTKHRVVIVDTDYDPCPLLSKAFAAANIDPTFRYPWKTTLWIGHQDVKVSHGYRALAETIWQKDQTNVLPSNPD